jgi:hypothetical protein
MDNLCCVLDKVYQCTACDRVFCQKCFEISDHTWKSGPSIKDFSYLTHRWWRCIQAHTNVAPRTSIPTKPLILEPIDD